MSVSFLYHHFQEKLGPHPFKRTSPCVTFYPRGINSQLSAAMLFCLPRGFVCGLASLEVRLIQSLGGLPCGQWPESFMSISAPRVSARRGDSLGTPRATSGGGGLWSANRAAQMQNRVVCRSGSQGRGTWFASHTGEENNMASRTGHGAHVLWSRKGHGTHVLWSRKGHSTIGH